MGTYRVWVATGADSRSTPTDEAKATAEQIIEPYDEGNDIPADWPGLSFDYYQDEMTVHSAGLLLEDTDDSDLPYAVIRSGEQHTLKGECLQRDRDALYRILPDPSELVVVMTWHS